MGRIPTTGRNDRYQEELYTAIVDGVLEAWNFADSLMSVGSIDTSTYSAEKGSKNIIHDHEIQRLLIRNWVLRTLPILLEITATMVSFGNHPEVLTGSLWEGRISRMRRAVGLKTYQLSRSGDSGGWGFMGVSSTVGMMSPLGVEVTDGSGQSYETTP